MRAALLAFVTGVLGARWWPGVPPGWLVASLAVAGLVLAFQPGRAGRYAGLSLAGLAWALFCALRISADQLDPRLDARTAWVEGRVVGLPVSTATGVRFELRDAVSRRGELPRLIRVNWPGGAAVRSGDRWRLALSLDRPRGVVNPGGFDYEAWLFAQGIGATAHAKDGHRMEAASPSFREVVREKMLSSSGHALAPLLVALVLGDDSGLRPQQWRVLQATGTVHLFVISGQHVGLLAGLVYGLVAGLARLGAWPRPLPWLPCACVGAAGAGLCYGLLAGFEVPVQRACVMICITLLWRWRYRHMGVFTPLLLALVAVLLINPMASLTPGFWLSFAAVAVLLLGFSGRLGGWPWWRAWWRAQWLVALGLAVVMSALGLGISFSGPLVNLLAVPWISFIVLPLALAGTLGVWLPGVGEFLLWCAAGALEGLLGVLAVAAEMSPPWLAPRVPSWAWLLAACGAVLLLLPAGVPLRWLGAPLILQLAFAPLPRPSWGQAQVVQLDVGQGLSILVRTRHHALLFDAGPGYRAGDAGERIVVPSVRRLGVRRLDTLIISHDHADHSGGAESVIRELLPTRVLVGEPSAAPWRWQGQPCEGAQPWEWDGVRFEPWRWPRAQSPNPASCVLLIEANGERLLLTGDIDSQAERALLAAWPGLNVKWLQAPHHGSRTSSSAAFLDALTPAGVLISRGWNNRFGHPHPEVSERLAQRGIVPFDSARAGAVEWVLGRDATPVTWRARPRLWRSDAAEDGR